MRLLLAQFKHETNTFSPVRSDRARFEQRGVLSGDKAISAFAGTNSALGAFLELARRGAHEVVLPYAASAAPSGPVDDEVFEEAAAAILDAAADCDAALLDLHGAMVTHSVHDAEGELLARLRARRPELSVAVALDLHANLTPRLVASADVICGYLSYPHVDMADTGLRAGSLLLESLAAGGPRPVSTLVQVPMLPHTLCMGTDSGPMCELQALARENIGGSVRDVSVFGGFPLADIADAGLSVVAVSTGERALAENACAGLARQAWARRDAFVYHAPPLEQSVSRARSMAGEGGPVILVDHADNCASGGTQDTMNVVEEVLRQGMRDVAVASIRDPRAVSRMVEAGIGAHVGIELGGATDMPVIGLRGRPLAVSGTVRAISDGRIRISGPMGTGTLLNMGPSAVLDTGAISFVVSTHHHEPMDLAVFTALGIEPARRRFLLLKSRIHFRAAFAPIARVVQGAPAIVECAGEGVTGSDYSRFPFRHVRRPVHPLDIGVRWG